MMPSTTAAAINGTLDVAMPIARATTASAPGTHTVSTRLTVDEATLSFPAPGETRHQRCGLDWSWDGQTWVSSNV